MTHKTETIEQLGEELIAAKMRLEKQHAEYRAARARRDIAERQMAEIEIVIGIAARGAERAMVALNAALAQQYDELEAIGEGGS